MSTAVSNGFQQSFLVFLVLVLTGCNYASQYEAQLACEEWVREGGTFTEHYKNPSYNPEPQEEDCTRILATPPNTTSPTGDHSSIVVEEEALCEILNETIQKERDADLYDGRRYIEEEVDLRQCTLEEQTRQYLGFEITSIQAQGKTVLLSSGKKIDPTGGAEYRKEMSRRFRF